MSLSLTLLALLDVGDETFGVLLKVGQGLAQNVKTVDHHTLLSIDATDQSTVAHHLAESL